MPISSASVAASGEWRDEDGTRQPAGEVHAWVPGTNQTVCGLALSRSGLRRFSHVPWAEAQPESGGSADNVAWVCPRCAAGMGGRRRGQRSWTRTSPRP